MYDLVPFKYIMKLESKGLKAAAFGEDSGEYRFLSSGQKLKFCNSFDHDGEYIVIGDGGVFNSKYINEKFSASDHTLLYTSYEGVYAKFVSYYLEANKDELDTLTFKGMGMRNISRDSLNRIKLPLPDLATQQRIAAFLDERTGKIDALVDEFAKFKANLLLQKRSLVSECVTKGLPSERDIIVYDKIRLKYGITISSGIIATAEDKEDEGEYSIYGANGKIGVTTSPKHNGEALLIGRVGSCGALTLTGDTRYWVSDNALIVKTKENLNIKFLYYSLYAFDFSKIISGMGQPLLTGTAVKNIFIAKFTLDEQQRIADYLDVECAKIDALIGEIDNQVNLLKTYRKSLINEVVTGKVEV